MPDRPQSLGLLARSSAPPCSSALSLLDCAAVRAAAVLLDVAVLRLAFAGGGVVLGADFVDQGFEADRAGDRFVELEGQLGDLGCRQDLGDGVLDELATVFEGALVGAAFAFTAKDRPVDAAAFEFGGRVRRG